MNFFKQQDQAKKQSRWLIFMFILAVLAIVVAIDLVLLLALGLSNVDPAQGIKRPAFIPRIDNYHVLVKGNA